MHKNYLLITISFILIVSCQRESDIVLESGNINDTGSGNINDTGSLLIKRVDESSTPGVPGVGTTITEFEYNTEKKLIRSVITSVIGNKTRFSERQIIRDSKGRFITIEIRSKRLMNGVPNETQEGPAIDTSIAQVVYQNEISRNISHIKRNISHIKRIARSGNKTSIDSMVYEYDSNDQIKKTTIHYLPWGIHQGGELLISSGFSLWVFDEKRNLTQLEQFTPSNGSYALNIRYRFEYDNKINPVYANEYVFLNNWFDMSPGNVLKQNVYIPITGENYDNTAVYSYRSDNKPVTVTYFSPPTVVNENRKSTFYYK